MHLSTHHVQKWRNHFFHQIFHHSYISHLSKHNFHLPKHLNKMAKSHSRLLPSTLSSLSHQISYILHLTKFLNQNTLQNPTIIGVIQAFLTLFHVDWDDSLPNSCAIYCPQIYPSHQFRSNCYNHWCSPFPWPGETHWQTLNCCKDENQACNHSINCFHLTHSSPSAPSPVISHLSFYGSTIQNSL